MKKYRVKALSCAAKRKVYQKGEIVSAASFEPGVAESLVRRNFLEEVIEEITTTAGAELPLAPTVEEEAKESDLNAQVSRETDLDGANTSVHSDERQGNQEAGTGKENETEESEETTGGDMDSISLTQLRKDLRERGVKFANNMQKKDLYALWLMK